jgi:hypothetical protein
MDDNEKMLERMREMASELRKYADDLDAMCQAGYDGSNDARYGATGDVVAGRAAEDITDNDIGEAVRVIKLSL